jgi:PLU-1-like protein
MPIAELEELDQEADSLPASVPETAGVRKLLQKAKLWQAEAEALSAQRAALSRMRKVLHAGERVGVEVSQVEQLRLEIRRRGWEDSANKVGRGLALDEMLALGSKHSVG